MTELNVLSAVLAFAVAVCAAAMTMMARSMATAFLTMSRLVDRLADKAVTPDQQVRLRDEADVRRSYLEGWAAAVDKMAPYLSQRQVAQAEAVPPSEGVTIPSGDHIG